MSLTTGLLLLASNSLLCLLSSLLTVHSPVLSVLAAVAATTLVATMKYRWISGVSSIIVQQCNSKF